MIICIQQSQHDNEDEDNLTKILISKYLSIISFCISLVNLLTVLILYLFNKKNLILKTSNNVMYNGSIMSLNSFDTEGYLRPNTRSLYESFSKNVDYRVLTRNILNICCVLLFSYLCIHVSIYVKLFPFVIVIFLKSGNKITLWITAFMNVIIWNSWFWNGFYKEKYIQN